MVKIDRLISLSEKFFPWSSFLNKNHEESNKESARAKRIRD
jgi:hypothetical protein